MFDPPRSLRRLLFVSRQFPLDFAQSTYGGFQRMHVLLRAACDVATEVDALFFVPSAWLQRIDRPHYEALFRERWAVRLNLHLAAISEDELAKSWMNFYVRPVLRIDCQEDYQPTTGLAQADSVASLVLPDTELIFAHRLNAALPVAAAKRKRGMPPVVVDIDDIEHKKMFMQLRQPPMWIGKALHFMQVPVVALAERRVVHMAAASFVCSEKDNAYLRRVAGCDRVVTVPNSVELTPSSSDVVNAHPSQRIVFVGSYNYAPNAQAAEHLIHDIFPLIRAAVPNAELELVGPRIETLPSYGNQHPGVTFRGFVDDLSVVWNQARLLCCPIRAGGGTRIKIIEAAARGVPVVSTRMGADGLDFLDTSEILLAEEPEELAEACIRVLLDDALARSLGSAALEKAKLYDRALVVKVIAGILVKAAH